MSINNAIIYIPLLDEGVHILRPTEARIVGEMIFLVLPTNNYDLDDEIWQFPPGTVVKCVKEVVEGDEILVAKEIAST